MGKVGGIPYGQRGVIYFIQCRVTGLVKIGWTGRALSFRLKALLLGSPTPLDLVGCIRGTLTDERSIHWRFKADRAHGEWFRPSASLDQLIEENGLARRPQKHQPPGPSREKEPGGGWSPRKHCPGRIRTSDLQVMSLAS
jgi:hypothetical protein